MSDFFDDLGYQLRLAVPRAAGSRWTGRFGAPIRLVALTAAVAVPVAIVVLALGLHGQSNGGPRSTRVVTPAHARSVAAPVPLLGWGAQGPTRGDPVVSDAMVARTADPRGGLPWGLRVVQTKRGVACVNVGRLSDGRIGMLGQDGSFGNDGRFHPLSPAIGNQSCGLLDARGHAFINVASSVLAASAGQVFSGDRCDSRVSDARVITRPCPLRDQRQVAYGLLGPDAVSVSYQGVGGRQGTEPTGPDGAFLVVLPMTEPMCPARTARCANFSSTDSAALAGPGLVRGMITSVTYRGGRVCRVPSLVASDPGRHGCDPAGYVAPRAPTTAAHVTTPITASLTPTNRCPTHDPSKRNCRSLIAHVSFTARVGIDKLSSYYEYVVQIPPHHGAHDCPFEAIGHTSAPVRAGQRLRFTSRIDGPNADCAAQPISVAAALVYNDGLGDAALASPSLPVRTTHLHYP